MVGFILHAGHRTTVVLPSGAEPWHPNLDTLCNPLGELCHLRLDGSLNDYIDKFYQCLTRCDELSEPQQITIFTAGLGEPLTTDVELDAPKTLQDAAALARAYIRRNTVAIAPSSHRSSGRSAVTPAVTPPPPQRQAPPAILGAPIQTRPKAAPGMIKLSPEEMARRREDDQCFKCPEKWSRAHQKT
jgi:hypothetical protein